MPSRRRFIRTVALLGPALIGVEARAADPMVDEKEPMAVALGYVADTGKANQAKYPNHTPAQQCDNCQLYQGRQGASSAAPCPLYVGRQVAARGWCSAYAKKA